MNKGKKTFAEKAYQTTQLDFGYTQQRITDMLNELGIDQTQITQDGTDYKVVFMVKLRPNEAPRKIMINVPVLTDLGETQKQRNRKKNAIFRVLFYHLKNRFVAVSNGLREFDEEFMTDIVVVVNGVEQRLGDMVVPEIKRQLKQDSRVVLKIDKQ
jgi:hypothetical protein